MRRFRINRARALVLWVASGVAACQFDPAGPGGAAESDGGGGGAPDSGGPDSGREPPDSGIPDAPDGSPIDAAVDGAAHLLLTEIKTEPDTAEFIEILNPLSVAVPLGDYYLSDDPQYALLPEHEADDTEVPVGNRDAILRFPMDAMLMPGEVIVVAMDEQGFEDAFGGDSPDYALRPAGTPQAARMRVVADGNVSMELTMGGEPVILFRWQRPDDLVTDVDIVLAGEGAPPPGLDDGLPDKSALSIDGPDPGSMATPYAEDGTAMLSMEFRSGAGGSYKRLELEGDEEPAVGSNGIEGHDETSENTRLTWEQTSEAVAPTPGEVPNALTN